MNDKSAVELEYPNLAKVFDHWTWECDEPDIHNVRVCLEAVIIMLAWCSDHEPHEDIARLRTLVDAAESCASRARGYLEQLDEQQPAEDEGC